MWPFFSLIKYPSDLFIFAPLKKLLAISLLSVFLLSTTELYELVKLPVLVEHFIEHKEQDHKMSLWEFLCMHYAHGDVRDADYAQDMKLPFKSHDNCPGANILAFEPNNFNIIHKPIHKESEAFKIFDEQFLSDPFLSYIWQPPKAS